MDHDPRFKTLIREFFADFLNLFFAEWAVRFDLDKVEWLDKEVQADPPDDALHILDLIAKVGVRDAAEAAVVLVHIEIESADRTTRIEPRLPTYFFRLRERHQVPVLPIVVYLKVGLDGIGVRTIEDLTLGFVAATVNYLYVGLPGLDAVQYLEGDNWLGVTLSVLMRVPKERISWLGAEALRRVSTSPLSEKKRLLLAECINRYATIDAESRAEFDRLLLGEPYREARMVNNIIMREAEERGERRGQLALLRAQLERKFGPLSAPVEDRLEGLPPARVREIALAFPTAESLAELGLTE